SDDQITFQNTDVATVQAGLQFLPPTDDTLTGGDGDDYLRGYGGNDTISGNGGNDILAGGSGADTIDGGDGNDTLYSGGIVASDFRFPYQGNYVAPQLDNGTEADTLIGGAGDDVIFAGYGDNVDGGGQEYYGDKLLISFQGAPSGIHFDGHLETQTIGGGTITGIENISWVQGSNYDDYVDVGTGRETGYNDFDVVQGFGGNDTLIAGYYTAILDGGDVADRLDGGAGNDTIDGGAGDDILTSGSGDNVLTGGAGDDHFIVGDGNNVITDFSAGDKIGIQASFSGAAINQIGSDVAIT